MNGNLDLILAILLGRKVKDDAGLWHVFDADGTEIGDPGGVLLRGNIGALLTWPNLILAVRRSSLYLVIFDDD